MIRQTIKHRYVILLGVLSVLVLLAGYTLISSFQHCKNPDDTTIPLWSQLGNGVKQVVCLDARSGDRWILADAKASGFRLFLGFAIGVLGAIIIGVSMGCFPVVEALLAPPLLFLAKIPPTAALAVFFVLVGTNTEMFVAMIAFGILPTLAQSVYLSVHDVREELIFKAYTLGASHIEVVWNIIIPSVLPALIDGVRLQLGPAMVYLVAAEMVCGDVGFGYRIRLQSRLLNMSIVYPYLAVLAGFGFIMDYALRLLQRALCAWNSGEGR